MMMTKRTFLTFLILLIFLASCSLPSTTRQTPTEISSPPISPSPLPSTSTPFLPDPVSPTPSPTLQPTATPTSTDEPTARPDTPTPTQPPSQNTRYALEVELDYTSHYLDVSEVITYTNRTNEALNELMLVVEANHQPWVFSLRGLTWVDGVSVEGYKLDKDRLRLPLREALAPEGKVVVNLSYSLQLPAIPADNPNAKPVVFGYSARQTNLVDWYPYVAAYREGEGWLVYDPWYFGETLVYEMGDYAVVLKRVDQGAEVVIAASAPAEMEGEGYRYQIKSARTFVFSMAVDYQVAEGQVGDVKVYSYHFPWSTEAGQAVLEDTMKALGLYEELFGPYPYASLSAVEADFLDGMEYGGLYFLSRGFYNGFYDDNRPRMKEWLRAIAVHETGHQWWYGVVGNDQGLEPWLDEALCTYMERLYYERYYSDLLSDWWAFRIDEIDPVGWVGNAVWEYQGYSAYRNAVYLRGAQFLEALRQRVGDEAFFAFLKDYATRMAGKLATSYDFFAILKEHTAENISDLLVEYFEP